MYKKKFHNVSLTCMLQGETEGTLEKCRHGVLTKTNEGFRFEESVKRTKYAPNPQLFSGDHVKLTRLKNGNYRINVREIDASTITDANALAFSIYCELQTAYRTIVL
ncbi:MAG: hypothetical protein PUC79_10620 [Prevotellaceae bacterium]|nr:hypothetical protein [Prevotellaceae bacterium]